MSRRADEGTGGTELLPITQKISMSARMSTAGNLEAEDRNAERYDAPSIPLNL